MASQHVRLGGSAAERFIACTGSTRENQGREDLPSPFAREGSAAHELVATCLVDKREPSEFLDRTIDLDDGGPPITVDEEMVESAEGYLQLVREEIGDDPTAVVMVEQYVDLAPLDPEFCATEPLKGSADVWIWRPAIRRVTVIDFKYGKGIIKEAVGNPQTRYYGAGVLVSPLLIDEIVDDVELIIHQPRGFTRGPRTRRELLKATELLQWAQDTLLPAARANLEPDAPLNAGPWCSNTFCKAAADCPALRQLSLETAQIAFSQPDILPRRSPAGLPEPQRLTPDQLARIIDFLPLISYWGKAVAQYAGSLAAAGAEIPGYKLVEGLGRRKWKSTREDTITSLIFDHGLSYDDLFETPPLKSPAKLQDSLKPIFGREWRAVATAINRDLVVRPRSSVALVKETDERRGLTTEELTGFDNIEL